MLKKYFINIFSRSTTISDGGLYHSDTFQLPEIDTLTFASSNRKVSIEQTITGSVGGDSAVSAISVDDNVSVGFADFDSVNWKSNVPLAQPQNSLAPTLEQQVNDLHLNVKHHSQPLNPFYNISQPSEPTNHYQSFPSHSSGYYESVQSADASHYYQQQQQMEAINHSQQVINHSQQVHANFDGVHHPQQPVHQQDHPMNGVHHPQQPVHQQAHPMDGVHHSHQAHQQVQRQTTSDQDRYAALANLDATVKAEQLNKRRHHLQKQISIGQQIFGAAPSGANPFLTKHPSNASASNIQPSPAMNVYQTNPFSNGHPSNPFM